MTTTPTEEIAVAPGESPDLAITLAAVRRRSTVTVTGVVPSRESSRESSRAGNGHDRAPDQDTIADRLGDLGFWPGTQVEVVCSAPFGGAAVYRLRGFQVALRHEEAARVRVAMPV